MILDSYNNYGLLNRPQPRDKKKLETQITNIIIDNQNTTQEHR